MRDIFRTPVGDFPNDQPNLSKTAAWRASGAVVDEYSFLV